MELKSRNNMMGIKKPNIKLESTPHWCPSQLSRNILNGKKISSDILYVCVSKVRAT